MYNKKGFAISGLIYSILLIFIIFIFSILGLLESRKFLVDKTKHDILDDMNEKIFSKSLIDTLLMQYTENNTSDKPINGLVKDINNPDRYFYRGTNEEVSNNFLWFGGYQWRILEFDVKNRTLKLITQQPLTTLQPAVTAWTNENEYNNSFLNQWLNEVDSNSNLDGVFWNSLNNQIKSNILYNEFNIGYGNNIKESITTQKVGILDKQQYLDAGGQNSFLDIKQFIWLSNRSAKINTIVDKSLLMISSDGTISKNVPNNTYSIRPIIKIKDIKINTYLSEGNIINNFVYYSKEKANLLKDVNVGEYIKVPYLSTNSDIKNLCGNDNMCTFRVISKEKDSIKLILNGLIGTSKWAKDATNPIDINDLIYKNNNSDSLLIKFSKAFQKYLYNGSIPKYFNNGNYSDANPDGVHYNGVTTNKLEYNVGLPVIGEILSSNDIALNINQINFVNKDLIENSTESKLYWSMNRYNNMLVRSVSDEGFSGYYNPFYISCGIRPVMFFNDNIEIKTGNGSPNNPYVIN